MRSAIIFELRGKLNSPAVKTFLWAAASADGLGGWVSDTEDSIILRLEGEDEEIGTFIKTLPGRLPRQFQLTSIRLAQKQQITPDPDSMNKPFKILSPDELPELVEADRAPCPQCIHEMLDPDSRFYHYPFTTCRNCGPRYSIAIQAPFTRMSSAYLAFPPCRNCVEEVRKSEQNSAEGNPIQACPFCGPSAFLMNKDGSMLDSYLPLESAGEKLDAGGIIGVKTYDGFIVLCNALLPDSVREMRRRKNFAAKPVSMMARDLETVRRYCMVSPTEEELLTSPAAPVVILRIRKGTPLDPMLFCPDNPNTVGVCLPPTAMLRLLFENRPTPDDLHTPFDVFAFAGGPKPVDPDDAGGDDDFHAVAQVTDAVLTHDLKIWQNGGSSVVQVIDGEVFVWRRSRGYSPTPISLSKYLRRNVLAIGSDHSASVALGYHDSIAVSQQMGTIQNARNSRSLSLVAERLMMIFAQVPDIIVCDMDIHNLSANEALRLSEKYRIPLATAQRHHANALACMMEYDLSEALAIVLDGGAYGPDGMVWGAELMYVTLNSFRRISSFSPMTVPVPSPGDYPNPLRLLLLFMNRAKLDFSDAMLDRMGISREELEQCRTLPRPIRTAKSHAAQNLFYAVAAALGIAPKEITYDLQLLIMLDYLLRDKPVTDAIRELSTHFPYRFEDDDGLPVVCWEDTFRSLAEPSWMGDASKADLAMAFLLAVARSLAEMAERGFPEASGTREIVLSGRLMMQPTFRRLAVDALKEKGFRPYIHKKTSPDESSVCIGQAVFGGMS